MGSEGRRNGGKSLRFLEASGGSADAHPARDARRRRRGVAGRPWKTKMLGRGGAWSGSGKERRGRTGGKGRGRCLKGGKSEARRTGGKQALRQAFLVPSGARCGEKRAGQGTGERAFRGRRMRFLYPESPAHDGVCPEPKTADLGANALLPGGSQEPCLRIVLPFSRKRFSVWRARGQKARGSRRLPCREKRRPAQVPDAEIVRGARAAGRV